MLHRLPPLFRASSFILITALVAGCHAPPSSGLRPTDAVLLKKEPGASDVYRAPGEDNVPYATNVVHVPGDARFSLTLEALHATQPLKGPRFNGKDLWLLIDIRTLPTVGSPTAETKRITRASVVKYETCHSGLIPLTLDEVTPFALEANTDYDIRIGLHEGTTNGATILETRFAIYRSADTLAPRNAADDPRGGTLIDHYQLNTPHQKAFLRFRIECMWSPVAQALAHLQPATVNPRPITPEQVLTAESLAASTRETFLKAAEEEKQARLAASDILRKSDATPSAQWEEVTRVLSQKTQESAAARTAMEIAQTRAREARQALEAANVRAAEAANLEKTAALAATALDHARRRTEAAAKALEEARDALQRIRAAADDARLKKEEWIKAETRARAQPDDPHAIETASTERRLAQRDHDARLKEIEDMIVVVAQKRAVLAEAEHEKQRAFAAKKQADDALNRTEPPDPRPAILRAHTL